MSATPATDAVVTLERLPGHVALVTLNRPAARNAISPAVAQALEFIVAETENDPDVWVVVLTGSASGFGGSASGSGGSASGSGGSGSGVFCAGADLKEIAAGRGLQLFTERNGFAGFVHAERSKPWIAAVNGKALAGGCEIVLACELVVAAEDAAFGLPEVSRGLVAAAGGMYRLPAALPRNLALELIMTAEPLDARRAHAHGLVNRLVPAERVVDEALALARRITDNAPIAVRESLGVARQAHHLGESELRAMSKAARDRVAASEDYQEGPRAFIEKRAPRWTGR
jgi:enoyl-CoA hydratase